MIKNNNGVGSFNNIYSSNYVIIYKFPFYGQCPNVPKYKFVYFNLNVAAK